MTNAPKSTPLLRTGALDGRAGRLSADADYDQFKEAIDYAQGRACFRSGEIRVLDSNGNVERTIPFNEAERKT